MTENVIIIGSGPAGLTAAVYTAREDFNPLVITGVEAGGQLLLTSIVENFPAFPEGINGSELIDLIHRQAEKFGARFIGDNVVSVDLRSKPFKVKTQSQEYESHSVIIATGASAKWLGIPSEKNFISKGISNCATCDAPFFKNKDVALVGGGDTAMEDSLFLARFVKSVTIIHRRDTFRASKIMQERIKNSPKINIIWNSVVEEIKGDSKVKSIIIKDVNSGKKSEMDVEGLFVAIGYKPNTDFLKGSLDLDEAGYIVVQDEVKTKIDGVYVAGDVADHIYRQAITASSGGTKAALEVRAYLQNLAYSK